MRDINFLIFAVFAFLFCVGFTNGLWISMFPNRLHHSYYQPLTSDKRIEEASNEIVPFSFPFFWNFFRPQRENPFSHVPEKLAETKAMKTDNSSFVQDGETVPKATDRNTGNFSFERHGANTVELEKSKLSDSFQGKSTDMTGIEKEQLMTTTAPNHIEKKFMQSLPKWSFFDRIFHPFSRFNRYQHFQNARFPRYEKVNTQTEKKEENENITSISLLKNMYVNETEITKLNSSMSKNDENCVRAHFHSRYVFVWGVNWSSLTLQLIFILLMVLLVSLGVFLSWHSSNDSNRNKTYLVRDAEAIKLTNV